MYNTFKHQGYRIVVNEQHSCRHASNELSMHHITAWCPREYSS